MKTIKAKTHNMNVRTLPRHFPLVLHPLSIAGFLIAGIVTIFFLNPTLPIHSSKISGVAQAFASYYNPCANAACGAGGYCGGNCGVVGPSNYVYQCSGSKGVMKSEEYCNYGCYTNPTGPDRCKSGTSATASNYTQCGNTIGACVYPQIAINHSVTITKNGQNTSGNWLCTDNGVSSACPTPIPPTPTPNPCAAVQGAATSALSGKSVKAAQTVRADRSINPQTLATGLPAISPKTDPTATDGPTFSMDDAKSYVSSHPFLKGKTTTGNPSSVADVFFTTDKKVTDLTNGEDPGLAPNAPVLVIIENGPFLLTNIPLPPGDSTVPIANSVISVFDARTGNRLMWGDYKGSNTPQ